MTEYTYREHLNSLEVEIEALRAKLKASQAGDLISRQAAIDALTEYGNGRAVYISVEEAFSRIEQLPSAQPEQRWIPCSERLPEEEKRHYWVCTDTGYQCQCRWTNDVYGFGASDRWAWKIFDIPQYQKVVAWMPLPEPYAERRTDGHEREN